MYWIIIWGAVTLVLCIVYYLVRKIADVYESDD